MASHGRSGVCVFSEEEIFMRLTNTDKDHIAEANESALACCSSLSEGGKAERLWGSPGRVPPPPLPPPLPLLPPSCCLPRAAEAPALVNFDSSF